jgi:hypothetical protein
MTERAPAERRPRNALPKWTPERFAAFKEREIQIAIENLKRGALSDLSSLDTLTKARERMRAEEN